MKIQFAKIILVLLFLYSSTADGQNSAAVISDDLLSEDSEINNASHPCISYEHYRILESRINTNVTLLHSQISA